MTTTKQITALSFAMGFAFLLGWFSQGYKIYSGFYDAGGTMMQEAAKQINGGKK